MRYNIRFPTFSLQKQYYWRLDFRKYKAQNLWYPPKKPNQTISLPLTLLLLASYENVLFFLPITLIFSSIKSAQLLCQSKKSNSGASYAPHLAHWKWLFFDCFDGTHMGLEPIFSLIYFLAWPQILWYSEVGRKRLRRKTK